MPETLMEYIKRRGPRTGTFKPKPFYNTLGRQTTWYWNNDRAYSESVHCDGFVVGHLHRSMETKEVIGVTIFDFREADDA